jgi:Preprotein translocase subunit SecA (ATPase, RNA helicase)
VLFQEREISKRENQEEIFKSKIKPILGRSFEENDLKSIAILKNEEFENKIRNKFMELREKRKSVLTEKTNKDLEKRVFLQTLDFLWRSHLQYLDHLRQVIGLRGYAQKDPLDEYKRESFKLFEDLLNKIKTDVITFLNNLDIVPQKLEEVDKKTSENKIIKNDPKCLLVIKKDEKISRNERCEATGKKFKNCCGAL